MQLSPVEEVRRLFKMSIEEVLNHGSRALGEYMNDPVNSFELMEVLMDEYAAGPSNLAEL